MNTEAITFGLGAVGPMVAGGAGALKHICTVVLQHMTCSSMLTMQLLALLTADTFKLHVTDAVWGLATDGMTGAIVLTEVFTEWQRRLALLACPAVRTVTHQLHLTISLGVCAEAIILAVARTLVVVAVIPVIHGFTLAPGSPLVQDTLSLVAVKDTSAAVADDLRVTLNVVFHCLLHCSVRAQT